MAETVTNRGKVRIVEDGVAALDLRMLIILGTQTGVNDPDLNTVADLDAVAGVSLHSERIALANETVTEDDVNDRADADAGDVVFAAAPGVTAQGAAIYDEGGGTDGTRDLIAVYTTNFPQPMDGGLSVTVTDWLRAS